MYFDLLGQPMIVLNSYDAAVDLLETRSLNTSDRPRVVMAELCVWPCPTPSVPSD